MEDPHPRRLIVAISGASGAIYGIRLLEVLKSLAVETHLIISNSAMITIAAETDWPAKAVVALADHYYHQGDIAAAIASGSFQTDGMIVAPCSMRTLASIAAGFEDNLITRAAGVIIKEQRKLALMIRETPLSPIHLTNMLRLAKYSVAICPPVPAFYANPRSIDDLVNHTVGRVLDLFGLETSIKRWDGI